MKITIAGAGAGKTTSMVSTILDSYQRLNEHQHIYCIAFTNNAVACIKNRLLSHFSRLPNNLHLSTIHSFLYNELIRPYYYLLYERKFKTISTSTLPNDCKKRQTKLSTLMKYNIIHQTLIPKESKWVIIDKSSDRKKIKQTRSLICCTIKKYIHTICIDEAQDMDHHMLEIIKKLDSLGINIILMGDPKQDLTGYNSLRKLLSQYPDNIIYENRCYRCPKQHLMLSNYLIPKEELQHSEKHDGSLNILFESDIDYPKLIQDNNFDLIYISSKRTIFNTKKDNNTSLHDNLREYLYLIYKNLFPSLSDIEIHSKSYYLAYLIYTNRYKDCETLRNILINKGEINKSNYINTIITHLSEHSITPYKPQTFNVNSIDSIKGQEGNHCLFILSKDLLPYLIKEKKDDTKIKNRLYVALTRSLDILTIYVLKEVEDKCTKEYLTKFFSQFKI